MTTKHEPTTDERVAKIRARVAAIPSGQVTLHATEDVPFLLAENDRLRLEREQWQRATGCVDPETIALALRQIGESIDRSPTEGIPDAIARLMRERERLRAAALPASVVEAMAGTEGDAEGCFDVAAAAASRCEFDTPEGRIQDAVSVAANGLKALALLTTPGDGR